MRAAVADAAAHISQGHAQDHFENACFFPNRMWVGCFHPTYISTHLQTVHAWQKKKKQRFEIQPPEGVFVTADGGFMDRGHEKWALCVYGRKAAPQGGGNCSKLKWNGN